VICFFNSGLSTPNELIYSSTLTSASFNGDVLPLEGTIVTEFVDFGFGANLKLNCLT
jgi:hypothetical protein